MGENLEGLVKFIYGTQDDYDAIVNYDDDALYFLTDTNKLYKGSTLIANYVNERVIAAALVDLNSTATSLNTKITKNSTDIRDISTRLSDIGEVVQEEIQPLVGQISDISTKLNDVSSNLSELDEVFAAVANDLNSRITVNSNNIKDISIDLYNVIDNVTEITDNLLDVSTSVETLDRLLAIAANDLDAKISNVSNNVSNVSINVSNILNNFDSLVGPSLIDLSTRIANVENDSSIILDLSTRVTNVENETSKILDLSTRMLDVSSNLEELDFILATVGTQLDQRITDVSAVCEQNYSQLNWIVINN